MQTKPCAHQDPGSRSSDHKRLTHTCLLVSRSLRQTRGSAVACCRVGALSEAVPALALSKEVTIIFITSTIVWPQVKQLGGNTVPPINRKLDSRFTEHGPAHQNKTQFPPQSVSPIRKLPKPFILIHQRADRMKTTIT